jgi:hypothetical protein
MPSSVRQSLSAIRVASIVAEHYPNNLIALPIIPYALSLSMSVAYKHFRKTPLITSRIRAAADLETRCNLLETVGTTWNSATVMKKLGRKALREARRIIPALNRNGSRSAPLELSLAGASGLIPAEQNPLTRPPNTQENFLRGRDRPIDLPDRPLRDVSQALPTQGLVEPPNLTDLTDAALFPSLDFDAAFEDFDHMFGDYMNPSLATHFDLGPLT